MVAVEMKTAMILVNMYIRGFFRSLIMNPFLDFLNSKWPMQHGCRRNKKNRDNISKNVYARVFGAAVYESLIEFKT